VINEVMTSNVIANVDEFDENNDWIEIYNNTNEPVYLGNYYLSDDESDLTKWQLPAEYLAPADFIVFYAANKAESYSEYHTNFSLSSGGEKLFLANQYALSIDQVNIPELKLDISYGRESDGSNNWGFFESSTPNASNNNSQYSPCSLSPPDIDKLSGSYSGSVDLNISHIDNNAEIRYNLHGNDPSSNDPIASGSITLNSPSNDVDYSGIPTNPAFDFPEPGYTESRANNRGWVPPYSAQNKINIIKLQAFKSGCISSKIVARTFLIDENHTWDVLSIQTDSMGFFSDEDGIYVWGDDQLGNYNREGIKSERACKIDFFDSNGQLIFSNGAGLRIAGNGSRHSTQKNLNVFFRGAYGEQWIYENLFSDSPIDRWNRLVFRSGGHRPDCLPKDEFATALVDQLSFDHAEYRYASTYLNGEYWGIHAIKERMNKHYLAEKYGLHKDSIAFLGNEGDLLDGELNDSIDYAELMDYAENNDLSLQVHYDSVEAQVDIKNFTEYVASEIFLGNADWPNSNIKFWRNRSVPNGSSNYGHDGKWRWVLFDLDGSFGGSCNDVFVTFNTVEWALRDDANFAKYTVLFRNLIENEQYKTDFINRTCDLINSSFKSSVTRPKLQTIKNTIDLEINDHIDRWRYPSLANTLANRYNEVPNTDQWEYLTAQMDTFLMERPHYVRKHMYDQWGLSDSVRLHIDVNDQTMGKVQVNSILIDQKLEGTSPSIYPWMGIYFSDLQIPLTAKPNVGYRFVEWIETGNTDQTILVTLSGDSTFTARFELNPNYELLQPVVINEIQSSNSDTYLDESGDFDDWIEIYNPNDSIVNLKGYYLTDDPEDSTKYLIDNDLLVAGNEHLVIWCDNENHEGVNHTNFSLNRFGDFIALLSPEGDYIDSISFNAIYQDYSYGRKTDGDQDWITFKNTTPNAPNKKLESSNTDEDLVVYPNPNAEGLLYFSQTITGTLFNSNGAKILHFQNADKLNINSLSQGIYYIKTNTGIARKILFL
tara:strand:+ start:137194 stop:140178 length:2985 start_codon:yes stop_codon:yes gene_type:complete